MTNKVNKKCKNYFSEVVLKKYCYIHKWYKYFYYLYVTNFKWFAPKLKHGVFGGELIIHGTIFQFYLTFFVSRNLK